jgi:gamma-glutamyltranspeptidase/glutathione hydrolase
VGLLLFLVFLNAGFQAQDTDRLGRHQVARSEMGMVVTAHPLATYAGVRILEQGGNAADAAVAAGFAVAVVRPSMNSIGGRNQILIRTSDGEIHGIDGTTQIPTDYGPSTATRAEYGYATIGTPGALAGLMRLHDEYGSLPLATVMAGATEYAESGFRLLPLQARFHATSAEQLAESEGARDQYLKPDGSPHRAGELLRQPVMARTLRRIVDGGADVFYRGEIAEAIAADMAANGGAVTMKSLADYRAEDARIVRGSYRGYELVALDVPASGAIAIQALQIMENFDPSALSEEAWAALVGQALALAIPDRRRLGSDTAAVRATSKAWAATQAKHVQLGVPVGAGTSDSWLRQAAHADDEGHTTHLSVADSTGMLVSFTQTIGPAMGSKVVTPGLGFLYAVTLGGYLSVDAEPGERARSSITPLMVLREGEPVLVLGAAGGSRIISAVIQAVTHVIDDDMSLQEALAAPRVHPTFDSTYAFTGLAMESDSDWGWTEEQMEVIREMGFEVSATPGYGRFGRIHGIHYVPDTEGWVGVADPGGEGSAAGVTRPTEP